MNDFLKKILAPQDEAALPPVPMKMDYPANVSEQVDPADMLPAVEEVDDESPEALASAQAKYKLKPGNANPVVTQGERAVDETELDSHLKNMELADASRVEDEISDSDAMQSPFVETAEDDTNSRMPAGLETPTTQSQLLSTYQQLKNAQDAARVGAKNIGILGGASKIAQGFATGAGAKIDANEAGIKQLMDQNGMEVNDIKDRMKLGGDEMNSPDSDISKFMREQAYAVLKKINPESDYAGKLEGMSAEQLQKLPGMKNVLADQKIRADWIATDRVTNAGHPVKFNKQTGTYVDGLTGENITGDQTLTRDIARKDELTGQYGYVTKGGGMQVAPTNYSVAQIQPQVPVGKDGKPDVSVDKDGKEKAPEYTQAQIAKAAPKVADELGKKQKEYIGDMKEARDTATAVTNLTTKLATGVDKKIDSGMAGSISTQAAKMAGQKGVLTDEDLKKFSGAGGWIAAAERAIANAVNGEMSNDDIEFFKTFNSKMGKSLALDIENRTQIHTRQTQGLLSSIAPGITEANVNKLLGADVVAPIVQDKSQKSTSNSKPKEGFVRFTDSKGGVHDIPKANLEAAKKRDPGLKVQE